MPLTPSTRWCPTPEQLMILEEMYRNGIKTPSASQIQQITAHLSLYGKIEGKNVFYWFQNHKARDRQKLRKKLGRHLQLLQQPEAAAPEPSAPPSLYPHITSNVLYQGCFQGATSPGLNLLEKLEAAGSQEYCMAAPVNPTAVNGQWTAVMMDVSSPFSRCREPLKTLDLFPVKSTGIKEDCGFSKSSSCSTSTS